MAGGAIPRAPVVPASTRLLGSLLGCYLLGTQFTHEIKAEVHGNDIVRGPTWHSLQGGLTSESRVPSCIISLPSLFRNSGSFAAQSRSQKFHWMIRPAANPHTHTPREQTDEY